ncbi:MAG: FAD binding domain-containing protein [Candidatus Dormibacteraeota bacterium]|nr:FAD binding domain-containing protein [Candidatus Dormibacteraeota bacterium]
MRAAAFDYARPESLAEALELLAEHGDDARPLAGGQSLLPLMALRLARPALLVDLQRLPELRALEVSPGTLRIGAMTTESELESVPALPPILASALPQIGHFQIRNRGTVGGSLAHMDPAGEWPALALLLDAELEVASARGGRRIGAAEFCRGPLTTALEADELLLAVKLRHAGGPHGFAEVARRPGDFALVGAACHAGRIVAFATGHGPQRLAGCERHLAQGGGLDELQALAETEIEAAGDVHVSAAYRRRMGARLVARVVQACISG